ncbi:MAG TPA: dTDP-glucose 4,6-dehydratase [Candidatus Eisenbacteria bacterium]|nr:dTDP-glucose 4,6-dehydratase [Candidatus Eisenbacteria bacterium]
MKLLVTGGAGFIGSAFVRRRLAATRDEVVVLDLLTYAGNRANLAEVEGDPARAARFRFVEGDIADAAVVGELVEDVDAVVNFAAESHVDRSILDAAAFLRTGVIGIHVLLEAVRSAAGRRGPHGRQGPRYLQVSTDEVYGSVDEGHSTEDDAVEPRSPYAAAKAAGDLLVRAYRATHGLDTVISRGANTYGPFQHPEKLVPLFITNALQDLALPLYGDGLQARDWLYVDDHADAIGMVLDRGARGGIYNIVGGGERTNREVTEAILHRVGRPWTLVRRVEDRPAHDRRYAMDGSRLGSLGWQPAVPFDEGISRTVDWYRTHEDWWRSLRGDDWAAYYEDQYGRRLAQSVEA